MAQKPLLELEVGAHVVRNRSKYSGVVWAGTGLTRRLYVLSLNFFWLPGAVSFLCVVLPRRGLCANHR